MTYMYRDDREELDSGLEKLLEELEAGDCMVVERFSGAAKNARDFLNLLNALDDRQIRFRSMEESFDTGTDQGKYAVEILKKVAQLDGDFRRERQREGINNAKEEGRYKGRKPIEVDEDTFDATIERWRNGEITARQAMSELNLKPNTFYRRVKERVTEAKTGDDILDAAKELGKGIIIGVAAGTEEVSEAAGKLVNDTDVETIASTVTETLEKNISAAGTLLGRYIGNLSKEFQNAAQQYEKKKAEDAAPDDVIDAEFTEDNEE